ncbi:MAG TPA: hypothetical protein VNM48_11690, partial [Chloroflexota bacterium]|nr:hypothetical protein [Chloroflexota bacterium]
MLLEALEAKSREQGRKYSYRDLERDSGINYSLVSKVVRGKAPASKEAIVAWGHALHPHLPVDVALMDAGFMPESPSLREQLREIVMRAQLKAGEFVTERETKKQGAQQQRQKPR